MARRQRRSTKRSPSHSTAARRGLTRGDSVRVKDGVMDPDDDGDCLGGWSGAIIACETWEQTPLALMAWDASPQRERIAPAGRRRAASQGFSAAQLWLQLSEGARVAGGKGAPRAEGQPREQGGEPSAASWTPPSCGQRYPEGRRLRDEGRAAGTLVRLTACRPGGRAESPCPAGMLAAEWRRALEATGSWPGMREEESEVVRQRAERRLGKGSRAGRWWQRWWWRSVVRPGAALGLSPRFPGSIASRCGGGTTLVSPLFDSHLALWALVWLVLMMPLTGPKRSAATTTAPATPIQCKRNRSNAPQPFTGLTTQPPGVLCARDAAHPQPAPPVPPEPMPPPHRRPRPVDTAPHCWPPSGCRYRGGRGRGNVRATGHPSGGRGRQFPWTACAGDFWETHGPSLPGQQVAVALSVHVLAGLAEGWGLRATARGCEVDPTTGRRWLGEAAEQRTAWAASLLGAVHGNQGQLDELDAGLREGKDGTLSEDEASKRLERARHWVGTAIDPESKLGVALESGPRTLAMAQGVVPRVGPKLAASWGPLGVTDGNRASTMACLAHCGFWPQPERPRAQGPAPQPRWLPLPALLSAQVVQAYRRRRLVAGQPRAVCGTWEAIAQVFAGCGWQSNTAFVERLNLDLRQRVAAVGRRGNTWCQGADGLPPQLALCHTYDPFGRPHRS
jgi:hypothetical protein